MATQEKEKETKAETGCCGTNKAHEQVAAQSEKPVTLEKSAQKAEEKKSTGCCGG